MARFIRRNATAVTIAALALTLLGGGIATAAPNGNEAAAPAANQPDGTTANKADGASQPGVSKADADRARAELVPSTAAGLPPTAQAIYAVVAANGAVARGFQVVSAARLATGQYQVVFNHDVTRSAFVATLGLTGSVGISPPGEIAVVGRTGLANAVFVQTWNSSGVPADRAFHLAALS